MKIIIASGNDHKVREFSQAFRDLFPEVEVCGPEGGMPDVEEGEDSFEYNAVIKANALSSQLQEGTWILADDSGLEVDALDGAPGIKSARYAGDEASDEDNVTKLLGALDGIAEDHRQARFVCCLVLANPDGEYEAFTGECSGKIIKNSLGHAGFGYDPVFIPEGYTKTFAQLELEEKMKISHRSKALEKLVQWLIER